jgi:hypothetical protein
MCLSATWLMRTRPRLRTVLFFVASVWLFGDGDGVCRGRSMAQTVSRRPPIADARL